MVPNFGWSETNWFSICSSNWLNQEGLMHARRWLTCPRRTTLVGRGSRHPRGRCSFIKVDVHAIQSIGWWKINFHKRCQLTRVDSSSIFDWSISWLVDHQTSRWSDSQLQKHYQSVKNFRYSVAKRSIAWYYVYKWSIPVPIYRLSGGLKGLLTTLGVVDPFSVGYMGGLTEVDRRPRFKSIRTIGILINPSSVIYSASNKPPFRL